MSDAIEFDPVDAIGAGAFGQPGARTFVIQARKGQAMLSVLVEKEQVALLATEAEQFLERIAEEHPEEPGTFGELATGGAVEEDEPLFRARLIGIGFDPWLSWAGIRKRSWMPATRRSRYGVNQPPCAAETVRSFVAVSIGSFRSVMP